jgi:hypothetical protein
VALQHPHARFILPDQNAMDDEAVKFYERYDFVLLPDSGKMFLPMATIAQLFPRG